MKNSRRVSAVDAVSRANVWVPDDSQHLCMHCGANFTLVRRRHHCRACGSLVCDACLQHRMFLPNVDSLPVRVCNTCANSMNEEKTKAVRVELHVLSVSDSSSSNDDSRPKGSNTNLKPNPITSPGSSPGKSSSSNFLPRVFSASSSASMSSFKASSRDTSVGKYAKVYLNDQLYGQTETTYFDTATSQFEFGSKGIYFDIPIPRIALGIDEAGRDITLYIEVYKSYKNSLSKDVLIGTSQISPFEILLSTKKLRETKDGTLASKERQEKRAFFHKKLSQSLSTKSSSASSMEVFKALIRRCHCPGLRPSTL